MKKIIKPLCCYLCAVMVLCTCFIFAFPCSASGMPDGVILVESTFGSFKNFDLSTANVANGWCNVFVITSLGDYIVNFGDGSFPLVLDGYTFPAVTLSYESNGIPITLTYNYASPFSFTVDDSFDFVSSDEDGAYAVLFVNSYNEPPYISVPEAPSLYDSAWDIFQQYIYGDGEMTPEQHLVLTLLATLIAVSVVILPFVIIWLIIRVVTSFMG